jgi:NAD(P)-dependent dehydrogenase (short-subunit alcohol dehydrogenase family)
MALLKNRIALITGASRGIGQAVAIRFAREGAQVIATARDVAGLEATDDAIRAQGGSPCVLVPLDLREGAAISQLAQAVAQRFGRLDVLVGNAGVLGELSPIAHTSPEEWERVLQVNLTANMQLIRAFDPLLQQSGAPRALFVSSGVARALHPYWGAYAVSKAALEMMVKLYAAENEKNRLRANMIDPGAVRTRMRAQAMPGEDPEQLPPPAAITDLFVKLASDGMMQNGEVFRAYDDHAV